MILCDNWQWLSGTFHFQPTFTFHLSIVAESGGHMLNGRYKIWPISFSRTIVKVIYDQLLCGGMKSGLIIRQWRDQRQLNQDREWKYFVIGYQDNVERKNVLSLRILSPHCQQCILEQSFVRDNFGFSTTTGCPEFPKILLGSEEVSREMIATNPNGWLSGKSKLYNFKSPTHCRVWALRRQTIKRTFTRRGGTVFVLIEVRWLVTAGSGF